MTPWFHSSSAIPPGVIEDDLPERASSRSIDEATLAALIAKCWMCNAAEPVRPIPEGSGLCSVCIGILADEDYTNPPKPSELVPPVIERSWQQP